MNFSFNHNIGHRADNNRLRNAEGSCDLACNTPARHRENNLCFKIEHNAVLSLIYTRTFKNIFKIRLR